MEVVPLPCFCNSTDMTTEFTEHSLLPVVSPAHGLVEEEPHGEEVDYFDNADGRHAHAEADQSAHVGEEVHESIVLGPLLADEVELLEEDVDQGEVLGDVCVVVVLRVLV